MTTKHAENIAVRSNLTGWSVWLLIIAKMDPAIWDALFPKSPKYSEGTKMVIASQIVKSVSGHVTKAPIKKELQKIGKKIFDFGTTRMNYDGDDLCPRPWTWNWSWPSPIPFPGPGPDPLWFMRLFMGMEVELNPQPLPPGPDPEYLRAVLKLVSDSMDSFDSGLAASLNDIAGRLI